VGARENNMSKPRKPRPTISPKAEKAIRKLLKYNWQDELEHYQECQDAPGPRLDGHIFNALVEVDNWLNGTNKTPAEVAGPW
jgi:hypothetical protein